MTYRYNLYVASSWRNPDHERIVVQLRQAGWKVYDYRHPEPGNDGFNWKWFDPGFESWDPERAVLELRSTMARKAARLDIAAMENAEACLLLLPSGRSSHLEAGWFIGAGREVYVLVTEKGATDVAYNLARRVGTSLEDLGLFGKKDEQTRKVEDPALRDLATDLWMGLLQKFPFLAQAEAEQAERKKKGACHDGCVGVTDP